LRVAIFSCWGDYRRFWGARAGVSDKMSQIGDKSQTAETVGGGASSGGFTPTCKICGKKHWPLSSLCIGRKGVKAEARAKIKAQKKAKAKAKAEMKAMIKAAKSARTEARAQREAEAKAKAMAGAEKEIIDGAGAKTGKEIKAQAMAKAVRKAKALVRAEIRAEEKARAKARAKAKAEKKAQAKVQKKAKAEARKKARMIVTAKIRAEAASRVRGNAGPRRRFTGLFRKRRDDNWLLQSYTGVKKSEVGEAKEQPMAEVFPKTPRSPEDRFVPTCSVCGEQHWPFHPLAPCVNEKKAKSQG